MFTKLNDSNLTQLKVGTVIRPIERSAKSVNRTVDSIHDKGLVATTESGRSRKFTWSQLVFLYEMEVEAEPFPDFGNGDDRKARQFSPAVDGPQTFWDVRKATTFNQRQAYTTHNAYIANTMAHAQGYSLPRTITTLIEERDTLLYTRGDDPQTTVGQYLSGRIAGIEFALGQFGVKF